MHIFSSKNLSKTQAKRQKAYFINVQAPKIHTFRLFFQQNWKYLTLFLVALILLIIFIILLVILLRPAPPPPPTNTISKEDLAILVDELNTESEKVFLEKGAIKAKGVYQRQINIMPDNTAKAFLYTARATKFEQLCSHDCSGIILSDLKRSDELNPTFSSMKLLYTYELKYGDFDTAQKYLKILKTR